MFQTKMILTYSRLNFFKAINSTHSSRYFYKKKNHFQNLLFFNPTHTKITSKLGLKYVGFQIKTIHGSFLFVKMPTKSIFLYGNLFNCGIILVLQTIFYQLQFKNHIFIFQGRWKERNKRKWLWKRDDYDNSCLGEWISGKDYKGIIIILV